MDIDQEILRIFETADDSLQGVVGYHYYISAISHDADRKSFIKYLPKGQIPHTLSWVRNYREDDLISVMEKIFEPFQSRISLIALVNVFEAALSDFIKHLNAIGKKQKLDRPEGSYKTHLKWAISMSRKCRICDGAAMKRLPDTLGHIDDARRLRNLIVHNNGLFDDFYEKDAIRIPGINPMIHPDYHRYSKDKSNPVPVLLKSDEFINYYRSHIEVLHVLYNTIQNIYFGASGAYSYKDMNKPIEWHKVLFGF